MMDEMAKLMNNNIYKFRNILQFSLTERVGFVHRGGKGGHKKLRKNTRCFLNKSNNEIFYLLTIISGKVITFSSDAKKHSVYKFQSPKNKYTLSRY